MLKQTLQDAIHDWEAEQGITDATMLAGQLEVIAEELRTANLIAYTEAAYQGGLAVPPRAEKLQAVQAQIEKRLGLS